MADFIEIDEETLQDIINIEMGLLYPFKGFMNETDFRAVVDTYRLSDGQIFTIPIRLDVPEDTVLHSGQTLYLSFQGKHVSNIEVEDTFRMTDLSEKQRVYGILKDSDALCRTKRSSISCDYQKKS